MLLMVPQTLAGYAFRALSSLIVCCYSLLLLWSFSSQSSITDNIIGSLFLNSFANVHAFVLEFILFQLLDVARSDRFLDRLCHKVSRYSFDSSSPTINFDHSALSG